MATTPTKKAAAKKAVAARSATARKAPTDHQSKVTTKKRDGFVSAELHGRTWYVSEDALDDFELLDDLNALDQRDDPTRMPAVLRRFLGDDGFKDAMDVLRDKDTGRVGFETGTEFVYDLMKALNPKS